MKHIITISLVTALTLSAGAALLHAHEAVGRAGLKHPHGVEVESEFYAGRRGYFHGGIGVIAPLNEKQKIGITAHFVREETGGEVFPSLGAEFVQQFGAGFELEAFSFGYFPVEEQSAWAVGLRASRPFAFSDHASISPFFGPTFARVKAFDEEANAAASISHLLFLGGLEIEAGPALLTLFGTYSCFSRDPVGLETHVDLEEMTHFAAYENNDGFARYTFGAELSYSFTNWLRLATRYAFIRYEDRTRHSISIAPSVRFGKHLEVFAGAQLLRGDGPANDLIMTGVAFSF